MGKIIKKLSCVGMSLLLLLIVACEKKEEEVTEEKINEEYTYEEADEATNLNLCDVLAFSAALYEEFFGNDIVVEMEVYGITYDYYNQTMGTYDYSSEQYDEYEKTVENDYSEFDKLISYTIENSGVYYIDFTEFDNDKYEDYYCVLTNKSERVLMG